MIGTLVSHYRVLGQIASGGMGVVYAARDERLGRDVVLKVIVHDLGSDPRWLERLRHEGRILAALRHPHIATIHDFDTMEDGTPFLVLENVEGKTLAQRLQEGPLPQNEALRICGDIARALQAAHDHRIVHRDLKPQSVMVNPDGEVKVLDFGLAERTLPEADAASVEADTATMHAGLLPEGVVAGTIGSMSPEQVRGRPMDARSDVFSLGCVLFECLTGRAPFPGDTPLDVTTALLTREPDWMLLPSPGDSRLRRLVQRCLEKDPAQRWPSAGAVAAEIDAARDVGRRPAPVLPMGRGNLPRRLTSFIGRGAAIAECSKRLRHARLLTLVGPGGCGKTRLAIQLAEQTLERFPDGVWLVDLAPITEPSQVPRAVAAALAVREEPGRDLTETISGDLRERQVLLLFDNCEHLVDACAVLASWILQHAPAPRILATSREPLGVSGELVWPVPTLTVPGERCQPTAHAVGGYEAVRLFRDRALLYQPDFQLTDRNAGSIADICRHLDGIPLAVELAAARINVLTPSQISERLDRLFRLLGSSARATQARHATLEATIDWSYGLLSEEEQEFLIGLAAFSGGWTLASATAVTAVAPDEMSTLDLLTRLVDKSLVMVELHGVEETRYRFLESVRQFALERLGRSGAEGSARDRHLNYFLALGEAAAANLRGPSQKQWLRRLESEHENLLSALDWSGRAGERAEKGLRLAAALWRFWNTHGRYTVARAQLTAALSRGGAQERTTHRAGALLGLGIVTSNQGDPDFAWRTLEESLSIYRRIEDAEGEGRALNALGSLANDRHDDEGARLLFQQSLDACRAASDLRGIAIALGNLGHMASQQGDHRAARAFGEESLTHIARMGDAYSLAIARLNLGGVLRRLNEPRAAREHLAECLRLVLDLEDPRTGAYALEFGGTLALEDGRTETAARLCGAARTLRSRSGIPVPPEVVEDQKPILDRMQAGSERGHVAAAWAAGEAMTLREAIGVALAYLGVGVTSTGHVSPGS